MTFYSWDEIDSVIDKFLGVKAKVLPVKRREGFEPDLKRFIQWRKQYQRALLEYDNQVANTKRGASYLSKPYVNKLRPPNPWYRYVPPMVVTLVREEDYV